jgi:hypothetical protein
VVADLALDKQMLQAAANYDAYARMRDDRRRACVVPDVGPQSLPNRSGRLRELSLSFLPTRTGAPTRLKILIWYAP